MAQSELSIASLVGIVQTLVSLKGTGCGSIYAGKIVFEGCKDECMVGEGPWTLFGQAKGVDKNCHTDTRRLVIGNSSQRGTEHREALKKRYASYCSSSPQSASGSAH